MCKYSIIFIDLEILSAPISEYYNALNQIRTLPFDENGVILPLVYPNGREAVISSPSKWQKEERLLKTPYNKVFYDPASTVESDWKTSIGINNYKFRL